MTVDARREKQLRIQALGAALSRREWWEVEQAYNRIRDEFDRRPTDARLEATEAALAKAVEALRLIANRPIGGPGSPEKEERDDIVLIARECLRLRGEWPPHRAATP